MAPKEAKNVMKAVINIIGLVLLVAAVVAETEFRSTKLGLVLFLCAGALGAVSSQL